MLNTIWTRKFTTAIEGMTRDRKTFHVSVGSQKDIINVKWFWHCIIHALTISHFEDVSGHAQKLKRSQCYRNL